MGTKEEEIKAACMELFLKNGKDRGEIVESCGDMPHYYLLRSEDYVNDIKPKANYFEFAITDKALKLIGA